MVSRRSVFWGVVRDWGLALGITLLVLAAWNLANGLGGLSRGAEAPDFVLADLDGDGFALSEQRGQVVVLNFWATWCAPCRQEIPELAAFHEANPDVVLVGVSVDDMPTRQLGGWVRRSAINYPVLHDASGQVARRYQVRGYPTTVVVGSDGTVRRVKVGAVSRASLERLVAETHATGTASSR